MSLRSVRDDWYGETFPVVFASGVTYAHRPFQVPDNRRFMKSYAYWWIHHITGQYGVSFIWVTDGSSWVGDLISRWDSALPDHWSYILIGRVSPEMWAEINKNEEQP